MFARGCNYSLPWPLDLDIIYIILLYNIGWCMRNLVFLLLTCLLSPMAMGNVTDNDIACSAGLAGLNVPGLISPAVRQPSPSRSAA